MSLDHRYVETNGVRLHVVTSGPPDGPMVLFLHGFPEFWYSWRHYLEVLGEAGWFCVAPDQRGYNLSPKMARTEDYAVPTLAQDALGLITAFGREKAVVVGHDWGGVVGWWLALNHVEHLHQFVAMNIPHPIVFNRTLRTPRQLKKSWYILLFQLPRVPEWFLERRDAGRLTRVLVETSRSGSFSPDDLSAYQEAWARSGVGGMLSWYRAAARLRSPRLKSKTVACPARLFWGVDDIALDRSMAEPSAAMFEDGRLELFPDAGHFVQHDARDAVTEKLLAFLGPAEANKSCRPVAD